MSEFFDFFADDETKENKALKVNKNINNKNTDYEEESEDENFTRALNKKAFQGKKGQMLMELQKSYKGDNRFIMDKRFQGDIDVEKVSQKLKEMTYAFDEKHLNKESRKINFTKTINNKDDNGKATDKTEEINLIANNLTLKNFSEAEFKEKLEEEKMKNLSILSSIISNQEFLSINKKINNPSQLLVKRFDPSLNIGQNLIVEKEIKKIDQSKNLIKLGKGMEIKSDINIQQDYTDKNNRKEMKKLNELRKQEKERVMKKIANEVNDDLEPVIEVNYDIWKNVTKNKTKKPEGFNLFSNEEIKENNHEEVSKTNNNAGSDNKKSFSLFGNDEENNKSIEKKGFSLFDDVKPDTRVIEKVKASQNNYNSVIEDAVIKKKKIENNNKDKSKDNNKDKDYLELKSDNKVENKKDSKMKKRLIESNIEDNNKTEKASSIKSDKLQKESLGNLEKGNNKELAPKEKEKTKDYELLKKKRERIKEKKEALKREEIKKKEKMDRKFENKLLQNFDKEKVENYIRYIDMCREKRNPKKK